MGTIGLSLGGVGVDVGRLMLIGLNAVVGGVRVRIDIVLVLRLVCRLSVHV